MDAKLESEIETIERQYIADKKSFTAVDIGNELKTKGINVRQRQVSPIVRAHFKSDIFSGAGYTRTLIPVKNGTAQAYLYFQIDNKPEDYLNDNQDVLPWDPSRPVFSDNGDKASNSPVSSLDDAVATDDKSTDDKNSGLGSFVASKSSVVYHDDGCMYASRIRQHNLVSFQDVKSAVSEGYRKCMKE